MTTFGATTARLPVADLGRSTAFYRDLLGFSVGTAWPQADPVFVILTREGARLSLFVPEEGRVPALPPGTGVYLEVSDATGLHEALRRRVEIAWGPEVYWYGRREFAILDPDGYMLIFSEETGDPPTCLAED